MSSRQIRAMTGNNSNNNRNNNNRVRFVTVAAMGLQLLLFGSLFPTVLGFFFRDGLLLSVTGKADKRGFVHQRKNHFLSGTATNAQGFHAQQHKNQIHENNSNQNGNGNEADKDDDDNDDDGLVFEGTFDYQSEIVPISTAALSSSPVRDDLFDFFSDPKNRELVIKGGGNRCEHIPPTPALHEQWTSQSKMVRSTPPSGGDTNPQHEEILAVYSEVPIVPGLSLRAVSYTGCKTMRDSFSALPYYEFTLLEETYKPVGKRAMTWIFDKVTGNTKTSNKGGRVKPESNTRELGTKTLGPGKAVDDDSEPSTDRKTYALSRVTLKALDGGGCKICYYGHVKIALSNRFLHVLPLPVGIVRSRVNQSIRKQLERECARSMEKFARALHQWSERSSSGR